MNEDNYGFMFNNITIHDNIFNKKYKNTLGKIKINNEIGFYLFIKENNIDFPMPKLLNYEDGSLSLQFIYNSHTLINIINKYNLHEYINKIKEYLLLIHKVQIPVSIDILKRDLNIEFNKKIITRYEEFDWSSNVDFNTIKYVNNIEIKNISYYCNNIYDKISLLLRFRNNYSLIHGDTHLGNILLDENDNIYFIDPRGYFGESKLFGIYEYDYAKILFGLSGYSIFDNMNITELNIKNNNLEIGFIQNYEYIFTENLFDEITILFCLSIWLGNNSCFTNINKKITSLMIAYYYCEKYLK